MKKFMEKFIETVRKYEELLAYAQGEFILPYHSGAEMIFQTRSKADAERLPVPGWGNMGRVTLS